VIGVLLARVITGVGWRLWHWRHGLPVGPVEPFHKNLIAYKTIAAEANSAQSANAVDPEEVRHWVERLERQLKPRTDAQPPACSACPHEAVH
jgi:hypothetical protein